jgi:hypothetical protein
MLPWIRPYGFHFFGFRNNNVFTEQGRQPCVQPPTWRTRSLYLYPPVTGWPSIPPGTGFPFRRLLRLAGLLWRYSNPLQHGIADFINTHIKLYYILGSLYVFWSHLNCWKLITFEQSIIHNVECEACTTHVCTVLRFSEKCFSSEMVCVLSWRNFQNSDLLHQKRSHSTPHRLEVLNEVTAP